MLVVECGVGLRYSYRHLDRLVLVCVLVGRAGDTRKENLMESTILGIAFGFEVHYFSTISFMH
jgi:hypothetical protein